MESFLVDEMGGLGGEGAVEGDDVGGLKKLLGGDVRRSVHEPKRVGMFSGEVVWS